MNQATPLFITRADNLHHFSSGIIKNPLCFTPEMDSISGTAILKNKIELLEKKLAAERINNSRKITDATRKAIEHERKRIGQELHDNINQLLVCANLYYNHLPASTPEQQKLKNKGDELYQQAIHEIRKLSHEMVSPSLRLNNNLAAHMSIIIKDFQDASHITVHFINHLDDKLPGKLKSITLLRILQEQLKNILFHSNAKSVTITLEIVENNIQLTISDDGKGMDPTACNGGIGLNNIKERVKQQKGKLDIITAPGKGFTLAVHLPVSTS